MAGIYNLLSEPEKEKVDAYSKKIHTERATESMQYKSQMVSRFALQILRENHPAEIKRINEEQALKMEQARERMSHRKWEACITGTFKRKKV